MPDGILWIPCNPYAACLLILFRTNLGKDSKACVPSYIEILGDSGYQGIKDIHTNSRTPIKKPKGKKLTKRQKLYNHLLSKKRIVVENIIRRCKIFRIAKDVYRGKHKNHGKVWNLIAGLVNLRYGESVI